MPNSFAIPILRQLVGALELGTSLLVEFESVSNWYETSLTVAAQGLRNSLKTQYHTFQHSPGEIRNALGRFGLNLELLEREGIFDLMDSFTVQTGLSLGSEERPVTSSQSLKLPDWSIKTSQAIRAGIPEEEKRWLHIDDNTSMLTRYNSETAIIDWWRTRNLPENRARQTLMLHSLMIGVASDAFYRQIESLADGIIEFKTREENDRIQHLARVKLLRGKTYDSTWRRLQLRENGEVEIVN